MGDASQCRRGDTVEIRGPDTSPQIVFVHGAGISKWMWLPQLEALSDAFRVMAFDLPGHGTSSEETFQFNTAVEVLTKVLAERENTPTILVGHSLGGYVAMEYAARNPDRISGLALSGSSVDYRGWLGLRTRLTAAAFRAGRRLPAIEHWFQTRTAEQIRGLPIPRTTAETIIDGGFYLHAWGEAGAELVGFDVTNRVVRYGRW